MHRYYGQKKMRESIKSKVSVSHPYLPDIALSFAFAPEVRRLKFSKTDQFRVPESFVFFPNRTRQGEGEEITHAGGNLLAGHHDMIPLSFVHLGDA